MRLPFEIRVSGISGMPNPGGPRLEQAQYAKARSVTVTEALPRSAARGAESTSLSAGHADDVESTQQGDGLTEWGTDFVRTINRRR